MWHYRAWWAALAFIALVLASISGVEGEGATVVVVEVVAYALGQLWPWVF